MVQVDRARSSEGAERVHADPAAQPGCRAVPPGRHAAGSRRHRRSRGDLHRRRLLQARTRAHLRRHHHPVQPGRTSRPRHGRRRAVPCRPAGSSRRPARPDLAAGRHAGDHQRGPLRPHRGGARPAAPAHRGRRRDRRNGLQRARRRRRGRRSGRDPGLRRRRAPGHRQPQAAAGPAGRDARPPGAALRPRRGHHRRADRVHRPRRAPVRASAVITGHRRRPTGHGQDGFRPRHGRPRRGGSPGPDARLLPRDVARRADPAACWSPKPGWTPAGFAMDAWPNRTGPRSARPSPGSATPRCSSTTTPT